MGAADELRQVAFNRDLWILPGLGQMNRRCRDQVVRAVSTLLRKARRARAEPSFFPERFTAPRRSDRFSAS
jgi:hypothetical protein